MALILAWWVSVGRSGSGNPYYAAGIRSMAGDGRLFVVGGLDPGGFVTLDKPPGGLWFQAGLVRLFGFSSWTLVAPSLLWVSLAATGVGWSLRRSGPAASAWSAGLVVLVTPGVVVLVRTNLPDAAMLGLACAGLGVVLGSGRWRVGALLFGLAVLAKPAALLSVPALVWAAVEGVSGWRRRLGRVAVIGAVVLAPLVVWGLSVQAMSQRPWIGGSSSDSVVEQLVGAGGAGRLVGAADREGWREADALIGESSAGARGLFRPVRGRMGQQSGWLMAAALVGGLVSWRAADGGRVRRVVECWGSWLAAHWVVYAWLPGVAHAYYAAMLAPPAAALVVLGFGHIWSSRGVWLTTAGLSAIVSVGLVRASPGFWPVLVPLIVAAAVGAALAVVLALRVEKMAAVVVMVMAVGVPLAVFSGSTLMVERGPDFDPAAGPAPDPGSLDLAALMDPIDLTGTDARWVVATGDELLGSRLIAEKDLSTMLVGGFRGRDPILTEAELRDLLVGEVGWALVSTRPDTPADEVLLAATEDCAPVVVLLQVELRSCAD
ncbi:MAG: glycosyltransferase family 39 protein [Sulfitobacter sp.]|nr:glycosyltransferase family 39 protein [Sulfitobacter sp.]